MLKLKIISFFLLLLLTLQVLPLKQIGKMLGSNQWTEELPHDFADEEGKAPIVNFNHPFLPPSEYAQSPTVFAEAKAMAYIHLSDQIPCNHSTEVVTPPPDFTFYA
jgi:hypothetical protein